MKILFLDFDGVLNSAEYFEKFIKLHPERAGTLIDQLDPEQLVRLNNIIEKTDANICISSTWRIMNTLPQLRDILTSFGFKYPEKVIAKTPESWSGYRGHEIAIWLEGHPEVTQFVIVDDNSDMEPHMDRFVQTGWGYGMDDKHMNQIIEMLNKPLTLAA
ncbi:MAG TPA: HAD domain-containing protein [Legionellaceae bacterium]|nr:HAD domain-containing protein [Legionellaceae bacterium]